MSLLVETNDSVEVLDSAVKEREPLRVEHHAATSKRRADMPMQPTDPWLGGVDWGTVVWFTIVHAGALAAPFFFTWKALGLFVGLYWLTGGIGICLGYHRLLTHGSFQTYRPVRWFIAFLGGLAGEGSAVIWVANHRKHHAHSDKEDDPHSPARRRLVEPHAVVHAQLRPQMARRHGRALRSRSGEGPGHSLPR